MKSTIVISLIYLFISLGCKKESPINSVLANSVPPPPPPAPAANTAPKAYAGYNIGVPLPLTTCVLSGFATDAESNITSYSWKKISGPPSYSIENPSAKITKLDSLESGTYQFEFTVTDQGGLFDKDTVQVKVYDPRIANTNEFIFKDLEWICPMGCTLNIKNFEQYVPVGTVIKVFIKTGTASAWVQVPPESQWSVNTQYVYGRSDHSFWIYTDDQEGTSDVKITY